MKLIVFYLFIFFSNISIFAQNVKWQWIQKGNGIYNEYPRNLIADSAGNTYVIGEFDSDTLKVANDTLFNPNGNYRDYGFITKFSTYGDVIWSKTIPGGGIHFAGITLDKNSNLIISGSFGTYIKFDSTTFTTNNSGPFIAKYDSSGGLMWAKHGIGGATINDVSTNSNNEIIACGAFRGHLIVDTISFFLSPGTHINNVDAFVLKYNENGNLIWGKSFGGNIHDQLSSVVYDSYDNLYLAGRSSSYSISFDGITLINSDSSGTGYNGYLVKIRNDGSVNWAKYSGTYNNMLDCVIDQNNELIITGSFWKDSIYFDNTLLINGTGYPVHNLFLVKYDTSGNVNWARNVYGNSNVWANMLDTDKNSCIYFAGETFSSNIYFNNDTLQFQTPNYGTDGFVAKYDSAGNFHWAKSVMGLSHDGCEAIAIDDANNCYIAGSFLSETLFLDNYQIENSCIDSGISTSDFFVGKISVMSNIDSLINDIDSVTIFPNPSSGNFVIHSTSQINSVIFFDVAGRVINPDLFYDENNIYLVMHSPGIYFIHLTTVNSESFHKIIVAN